MAYCKRLIEVDLPIKTISEYASSEKNIRSGHPWQLHIWWARRPWGACRSVIFSSVIPDPLDPNCPKKFLDSLKEVAGGIKKYQGEVTKEDYRTWLLSLTAKLSEWECADEDIDTACKLMKLSLDHEKPMLLDSFSGNGAIPGEGLRLGCDSVAIDLNPVAITILRTLLEAIPKDGDAILEKYDEGSSFLLSELEKRLSAYYPKKNGRYPIAYLWARTVRCEGPDCGAVVPLISQTTLAKGKRKAWVEVTGDHAKKEVYTDIKTGDTIPKNLTKTAGGGSATCPACGYTTPKQSVKKQGKEGKMGHRLFGIAVPLGEREGKGYLNPTDEDRKAFNEAVKKWKDLLNSGKAREVNEEFVLTYGLHVPPHYGISKWGDIFSERQKLLLYTIAQILDEYSHKLEKEGVKPELIREVITTLALAVSNATTYWTNLSYWGQDHMNYSFMGMGIAMRWDWAEGNPLVPSYAGGLDYCLSQAKTAIESLIGVSDFPATVINGDATKVPLPDDSIDLFFTDPPYYDVVPYADLSDLCYVWLKRFIGKHHPDLYSRDLTPKKEQIVVNPYSPQDGRGEQSSERYTQLMTQAFKEGRRVLKPGGIGVVVFAHKGTAAWEALLSAIIDAGFYVTASWPIDTERASRMRANKSAALQSSIHLVVRPRESLGGSLTDEVGDWRDVLSELPIRIHDWMPRLREEGVVGADAIFACLGPALEIFSRYSRVERAGELVSLNEYLEHVWAAVSREGLNMIFSGADAQGLDGDARLTAMWLWTLSTGTNGKNGHKVVKEEPQEEYGADDAESGKKLSGYALEYDAARKISQGLGVNLDDLAKPGGIVEIKGSSARLLSVGERQKFLFGKKEQPKESKRKDQLTLFGGRVKEDEGEYFEKGATALDRLHQAMLMFSMNRNEALKRFLIDDGVGSDEKFWKLADALNALYPAGSEEQRWIQGLLAKKKGMGF